nr:MAG TPA: hypothetical protein [Caudoviricetes sp.]
MRRLLQSCCPQPPWVSSRIWGKDSVVVKMASWLDYIDIGKQSKGCARICVTRGGEERWRGRKPRQ